LGAELLLAVLALLSLQVSLPSIPKHAWVGLVPSYLYIFAMGWCAATGVIALIQRD